MRIRFLLTLGALLLTITSMSHGQDDKQEKNSPKEAAVELVAEDINPELRKQICGLLSKEVDRIGDELKAEEEELKQLREKLKSQEEKVERSKLKLKFLNERLNKWQPEEPQE